MVVIMNNHNDFILAVLGIFQYIVVRNEADIGLWNSLNAFLMPIEMTIL